MWRERFDSVPPPKKKIQQVSSNVTCKVVSDVTMTWILFGEKLSYLIKTLLIICVFFVHVHLVFFVFFPESFLWRPSNHVAAKKRSFSAFFSITVLVPQVWIFTSLVWIDSFLYKTQGYTFLVFRIKKERWVSSKCVNGSVGWQMYKYIVKRKNAGQHFVALEKQISNCATRPLSFFVATCLSLYK